MQVSLIQLKMAPAEKLRCEFCFLYDDIIITDELTMKLMVAGEQHTIAVSYNACKRCYQEIKQQTN